MPRPSVPAEPTPLISAPAQVRTSAGVPAAVPVTITNRSAEPRVYMVSPAGVDAAWLPLPSRSTTVGPGESIQAELTLRPTEGTVPARYPLAIAVQALDPVTDKLHGATAIQEIDLIVGAPGQIALSLDPPDSRAVHSRKLFVVLQNSGQEPQTVRLEARSPQSTAVDLTRGPVVVPPASTMRVPARLTVSRPTLFRRPVRHTYSVTARTSGAPRYTEGSLTAKSLVGPTGAKIVAAIAVVALWVTLALIFVPKLADKVRKPADQAAGAVPTLTVKPPGAGGKSGTGKGGKGGGNSPSGGGSGTGGTGGSGGSSGGSKPGGASPAAASVGKPKKVQISGTVSGAPPAGVRVSIFPTTFGSPGAAGDSSASPQSEDTGPIGKLTPDAIEHTTLSPTPDQSGPVGSDGSFAFTVQPLGFYVLQVAEPGYQTQRYVIDPTSATVATPMKIALVPGTGSLHGVVHDASGGNVGGATITLTDGTNTVTTSTVSKGAGVGTWSVDGLSTPSSYLVSASHDGLGVASHLVTLAAGATAPVDLTMSSGEGTLTGVVRAMIGNHNTRLGGITVSATDGTTTRTSTTVTTGSQTGLFTLPQLTVGTWTVTISGSGYQLQTAQIKVAAGQKRLTHDVQLTPSTVNVTGWVTGVNGKPLRGAGLTLTDTTNGYKQTSLRGGAFSFNGVAPGTYTLTADYSGYKSQTQSLKATLGTALKPAHFALKRFHVTHDSTIVGYAANALSSSSSFGCLGTTAEPIGCTVYFRLLDANGDAVPVTLDPNGPNTVQPSRDVSKLNGPVPYTLQVNTKVAKGAPKADGLEPGQYQLVISSPGFIPAKVEVQVPLNGVAAVPQLALKPDNVLAGHVKFTGDLNTSVMSTDYPDANCVLALPQKFDSIDPNRFFCNQDEADAKSTPKSPAFGPADVQPYADDCTFTGSSEPAVEPINDNGSYSLPRLCNGPYWIYVIIGNHAYVQPDLNSPIAQTFLDGQTVEYDPSVDRYPTLTALISNLDPKNGNPQPDAGDTITLICDNQQIGTGKTDSNGSVKFYGVPVGAPDCTVTDSSGNVAGVPDQFRELNQDYSTLATIVNQTMTLVGQLVSNFGSSTANPIANVPVTITAVTHYSGSTPITETAQAITNAQGCYAVQPNPPGKTTLPATLDLTATDDSFTDCGTLTRTGDKNTTNIAVLNATQTSVHVSTAATTQVAAFGDTAETLLQIPSATAKQSVTLPTSAITSLVPNAVSLNTDAQQFQVVDPAGNPISIGQGTGLTFAGATLTVTKLAASGSGTINAGVTSDGFLTWNDSKAGASNIWPGRYQYTLSMPGYKALKPPADPAPGLPDGALQGELDCGYKASTDSLGCTLSNAQLVAFGTLSGNISTASGAVPNADVYLDACTGTGCDNSGAPGVSTCPTRTSTNPYYAKTDSNGFYNFSAGGVRQVLPGTYRLIVCASQMLPSVQKLTITATTVSSATVTASTTQSINVTMQWLGSAAGQLVGFNGTKLSGVTVRLTCTSTCTTPDTTTTTDSDGQFAFASSDGLSNFLTPGSYLVSAQPVGYEPATWSFTVSADSDRTAPDNALRKSPFQATALGGFSGTVTTTNQLGATVPVIGATVSMSCAPVALAPCAGDPTPSSVTTNDNGKFTFLGGPKNVAYFLTAAKWEVTVSATGYAGLSLDGTTYPYQQIGAGDNSPNTPLVLTPLGSLSGTVTDSTTGAPVPNTAVHAVCSVAGGCGNVGAQDTSTDSLGKYSFGSVGARNVFGYGTWTVTTTPPTGYYNDGSSGEVTFSATNTVGTPPDLELRPYGSLSGNITDQTNSAVPIVGATVSAVCSSGCGSGTPPTVAPVVTDSSGNFAFGTAGNRNVFPDGTWTVSIKAPIGYNEGSAGTFTFKNGFTNLTASSLRLRPEGSLSGKIMDSTNPATVPVVGATVTATCQDSVCASATAPAAVLTDSSGNFAFGTAGNRNVFPDGTWQLSMTGPSGYNTGTAPSTYIFSTDSTSATADSLTLRPMGSLTGKVVDSTNNSLAVPGATVRAMCSCGTVDPVVTDSSGNFAFGAVGARNVFPDGTWTVSVTAPSSYSDSGPLSPPISFGTGNPTAPTLTIDLDPLGSLTGTVSGIAAATQRLASVTVTADRCGDSDSTNTNCSGSASAGTEYTAVTSDTGVYIFNGNLTPGRWKLSTSATGYTATSQIVHVVAGANNQTNMSARTPSESPNLTMNAVLVDLPIQVLANTSGTYATTKHAVVTLSRADNVGGDITTVLDSSTSSYWARNLVPTVYNVTVYGDSSALGQSIQSTTTPVTIAPTDPATGSTNAVAPVLKSYVQLLDFAVTGKIRGTIGDTGTNTTAAVANVPVVLLTDPPATGSPNGTVATNVNGDPIFGKTGSTGAFTLGHVPNGSYYLLTNQADPDVSGLATPVAGFLPQISAQLTVLNGTAALGTITPALTPVTNDVTVTVSYDSGEDLSGGVGTLTPTDGAAWTPPTVTTSTPGTAPHTADFTFTAVPRGCWAFSLPFAAGSVHVGSVSTSEGTTACPITVSATPSTAAGADYTFDEHILTVTPTITPNPQDTVTTAPTYDLWVKHGTTAVDEGPVTSGVDVPVYLVPGNYTAALRISTTPAPSTYLWTDTAYSSTVTLSSSQKLALSAAEASFATLNVTYVNSSGKGGTVASPVQLSVACASDDTECAKLSSGLIPTAQNDTGSGVTFTLPAGSWVITASGDSSIVGSKDTYAVTLTAGQIMTIGAAQKSSWK